MSFFLDYTNIITIIIYIFPTYRRDCVGWIEGREKEIAKKDNNVLTIFKAMDFRRSIKDRSEWMTTVLRGFLLQTSCVTTVHAYHNIYIALQRGWLWYISSVQTNFERIFHNVHTLSLYDPVGNQRGSK